MTAPALLPALLGEFDAARYLGIGKTTLRRLGIRRRRLGGRLLYDRRDLDAFADSLPYEGEGAGEKKNTCDEVFG